MNINFYADYDGVTLTIKSDFDLFPEVREKFNTSEDATKFVSNWLAINHWKM